MSLDILQMLLPTFTRKFSWNAAESCLRNQLIASAQHQTAIGVVLHPVTTRTFMGRTLIVAHNGLLVFCKTIDFDGSVLYILQHATGKNQTVFRLQ